MTLTRLVRSCLIAMTLVCSGLDAVFAQEEDLSVIDQEALARSILSEDSAEQSRAVTIAGRIASANRSQAVRSALVQLMERHTAIVAEAARTGRTVDQFVEPEFTLEVLRVVGAMRDPQTIPAMARAMGTFSLVRTLADFGEQAAPAVLDVVTDPTSHYTAVDDGLFVLRFMVERRDQLPLSHRTIEQIRQATFQLLTGRPYFTSLWYAIDLASVLDAPQLTTVLQEIARSPVEVRARGVEEWLIDRTQRRAADRLAGIAPMPRPPALAP